MTILPLLAAIEDTAIATAVRESDWLFPTIETIHVFGLALMVGTIAMVDLRVLGFVGRRHAVTQLSTEILPWTWVGFVVAAVSGALMFASSAERYASNLPFQLKLGLIGLAGLNMLAFHFLAYRSVGLWDSNAPSPTLARLFATLSLVFWLGVVTFGRWIGFV